MDLIVLPSKLKNSEASVPGDKSISHRALIFSAIADGTSSYAGFLLGSDCLATLKALSMMGINIEQNDTKSNYSWRRFNGSKKNL